MGAAASRNWCWCLPAWGLVLFLLAPLALAQSAASKPDRAVVQPGESQSAIEQSLGRPDAVVEGVGRTFLMYPEGRIILENNQAVEIPPALLAPVAPPAPAPVPVAIQAPTPTVAPAPAVAPAPVLPAAPLVPPAPAVVPAVAPAAAAVVPAAAPGTASPKPATAAVSPAPAKPATPAAAPPEAPSGFKLQVPMWAWVIVGVVIVFGGLKLWDSLAAGKTAPGEGSDEAPAVKPVAAIDVPVPAVAAEDPPAAVLEEPVAAAEPEPEVVRTRIPLRARAPEPVENPPPAVEPPTPAAESSAAPEEAPRLLKLTRKAPAPSAEGEKKS